MGYSSDATSFLMRAIGARPLRVSVIYRKSFVRAALFLLTFNSAKLLAQNGTEEPSYWPYGTISGPQSCLKTFEPPYIGNGAPLILAKAMAYDITGNTQFAASVRERILDLTDTSGYGGEDYSGGNQCILNLARYIPSWIIAAELIEDYPGWSSADKQSFQKWLANEIYKKVDWASDNRSNNWGSASSATAALIADYLEGSGIPLIDRKGKQSTPAQAFAEAKQRQLDRMNGNPYMDNTNCHQAVGIRADGGIPEELARGSTGCSGQWIQDLDDSWIYTMAHLQGTVAHAELLLRRGDPSIYTNMTLTGAGSLLKAILFLLHNPNDPSKSVPWKLSNDRSTLELAYRFYQDPYITQQLGQSVAHPSPPTSAIFVPSVIETSNFRTNLGMSNLGAGEANVTVELVDPQGTILASKQYTVPANGLRQINHVILDLFGDSPPTSQLGYLILESDQAISAFAVSIDNVTQDSSFMQGTRGTATHLLLPTSTSTGSFKTTLTVINDSSGANQIELKLRDKNGTIQASKSITLAPYGFFHSKNIHGFLGVSQTFGPIEITSVNATPSIIAVARVYSEITTNDGVGTTGSSFTACPYPN